MNPGAHTARDTALLQVAVSHHTDVEEVESSLPPGLVAALVVPAVAPSLGRPWFIPVMMLSIQALTMTRTKLLLSSISF